MINLKTTVAIKGQSYWKKVKLMMKKINQILQNKVCSSQIKPICKTKTKENNIFII